MGAGASGLPPSQHPCTFLNFLKCLYSEFIKDSSGLGLAGRLPAELVEEERGRKPGRQVDGHLLHQTMPGLLPTRQRGLATERCPGTLCPPLVSKWGSRPPALPCMGLGEDP